jgi:hypothetical protein
MKWRLHHILLALILAQAAHSIEEFAFRLYDVLAPAQFVSGMLGIDRQIGFAVANSALVLFGLWCWYARVRRGRGRELAWLWALVEIANGCGHLALAVWAGGYFPGLATAPLLIGLGGWLALALRSSRLP